MSNSESRQTSFVTKVIIVAVAIVAVISFLTPDVNKLKNLDTPVNKLYLLSFVNNPEALYMVSEHWEKAGKYDNAVREMRLAIGLLEMHHADAAVLKRYRERLEALKGVH
jgi:hypothetical protein